MMHNNTQHERISPRNWLRMSFVVFGAVFLFAVSFTQAQTVSTQQIPTSTSTVSASTSTTPKSLQFLGNQNIAPVVFNEDGIPTGVAVDITKALAPYLKEPIEIRAMDWLTAQLMVAEGQADALIQINATEERKKTYDFSDTLLETQFSIFARTDRVDIKGITSLHGLKVGVEQGGFPQTTLSAHPEISLIVIPNFLDGFKQVSDGVLDAVVVDNRVGSYILAINNIKDIYPVGEPVAFSYSTFAVKKGNTALLDEINNALRTIKRNGMYQAVLTKWKPTETVIQTEAQITREIYFVAIIVLSILFIIAVVWSLTINRELSRRKKAEKYAEKLVSGANAMIIGLDTEGKVTVFNEAAAKITGYKESEVIGKNWFELIVPHKRYPEVWKIFEDFKKQGKSIVGEFKNPILTKNGEERIIEWRNSDLHDNGNIVGTISYGIDITEREKTGEALRTERELFIEGPTMVFRWRNAEGWPVEYVSANITQQLGYTPESLTSGKIIFANLVHPDDIARVGKEVEENEKSGAKAFKQTYRIKHADGSYRWVDDFTTIIRDNKGQATHFLGYVMDITEREKAEETSKLMVAIVETSDDAIYSKTPDSIITTWNEGAEKMFGFTASEAIGKSISLIVPENKRDELNSLINKIKKGERVHHFETTRVTKNGRELQVSISLSPIFDEHGKLTAISAISRDVTERKKTELEIIRMNRALRMVSEINAALIHVQNENDLLNDACKIAVSIGGYLFAWIGYAESDEEKTIRPVAHAGTENGYLESLHLTWTDTERGRGPSGTAIRTLQPVVSHDIETDPKMAPWRKNALQRGYRSSLALPLVSDGQALGEFCIYSKEPNAFADDEIEILKEVANDIAFGIVTLRTRTAEKLAEERFEAIFNNVNDGVILVNNETMKFELANETMLSMLGYNANEFVGLTIENIHPKESVAHVLNEFKRQMKGEIKVARDLPVLRKNGSIFYADINTSTVFLHGKKYALGVFRDITERKELELEREQFLKFFDISPDIMVIADPNGAFKKVNPATIKLLGYTEEELIAKPFIDFVYKDDQQSTRDEMARQMKTGTTLHFENRYVCKDGKVLWMAWRANFNKNEGITYATGRDITENKQVLNELMKLQKAADTSGEAIYMTDKQGIFTYVNSAFTKLYGFSANEVIGKVTPRILKSGMRPAEVYVTFWKDLLAAKVVKDEHINKTKDGKMLTIDSSVNPILDERGEIIGFLAIQRDITEREKANETIREDEAELKEAQRIGNYGNFDWDSRTDTIKWSDEYYRIYGFVPGSKPPGYEEHLKAYTPESAARLDAAVKNSMATGEPYEVDIEQAHPAKNAARWITARGEVKRDEHNKIIGLRGTAQDITARKQSEERINELSELRSKFLNIMAHQLRTPLSSVNWNLEMLIGGDLGKIEETQKKFLQVTYGESKKITNRIRDLLAAVDIEDKRVLVKKEEVAIDSLTASIIAEAREHARTKDITFNYEGPREALPPIMGDAEKLRIAISQLAENAVTYTKENGKVSASLSQKGNVIRFEVKDTGIGIPESEQKRIHERFYRASNASVMHPDGFGLGLYVTKYFIEQHGGTFGFTSKENEGSTFWFEIPIKG